MGVRAEPSVMERWTRCRHGFAQSRGVADSVRLAHVDRGMQRLVRIMCSTVQI